MDNLKKRPWSRGEAIRLKSLTLSPVLNSPDKLLCLVRHFKGLRPSVFAVTDGTTQPHVSKGLATKVRDLTVDGKLDWVLSRDKSSDKIEARQEDELRSWIRSNYPQASRAVTAYKGELRLQIAREKVHRRGTGSIWPPSHEYGVGERSIIEGIIRRDSQLSCMREQFMLAISSNDFKAARKLETEIGTRLEHWLVI